MDVKEILELYSADSHPGRAWNRDTQIFLLLEFINRKCATQSGRSLRVEFVHLLNEHVDAERQAADEPSDEDYPLTITPYAGKIDEAVVVRKEVDFDALSCDDEEALEDMVREEVYKETIYGTINQHGWEPVETLNVESTLYNKCLECGQYEGHLHSPDCGKRVVGHPTVVHDDCVSPEE